MISIWISFPTACCLIYVLLRGTVVANESCKTNSLNMAQNVYPKHRLTSRLIDSKTISEPIDCYINCMKNWRCVSYNVCNSSKLCELNSEKKDNSIFYKTSDDCDYHEFIFNNQQRKACKDSCCFTSQPCLNGGRCQATCMENGKRFQCDCTEGHDGNRCERAANLPRSCSFYANSANRTHGLRRIYSPDNKPYSAFCHFGLSYTHTLAMSYSLENKAYFQNNPLTKDFSVSEDTPNWTKYRLSFGRMAALRNEGTMWKIACSYNLNGMRHGDQLKVKTEDLDPLSSATGIKFPLVKTAKVNGEGCHVCTVALSQEHNAWHIKYNFAHHCSSNVVQIIPEKSCSSGNFSYFGNYNNECIDEKHSCTSSMKSTTQLWFMTYYARHKAATP